MLFFLKVISVFVYTAGCMLLSVSHSSRPFLSMFEIILIAPTELQSVPPDLAQTWLNAEHQSAINLILKKTRHALSAFSVCQN